MPLASQKRVEGSPDSVAIRSRFGRDSVAIGRSIRSANTEGKAQRRQNVAQNGIDLGASVGRVGQLIPKTRRKDGKMSRKAVLRKTLARRFASRGVDSVAIRSARRSRFGRPNTEEKVQRRQKVAQNGLRFGFGRDWSRRSRRSANTEEKVQRRQNVAQNGIDLGAIGRRFGQLIPKKRCKDAKMSLKTASI